MGRFNLLPTYSVAFASVAFCAWVFFTSAHYRKTLDGKFEVWLAKDGSKKSRGCFEAEERIRLQLRYDVAGGLHRWVGGHEVRSDEELASTLRDHRSDEWDFVPASIDALPDMSWSEVVRTMGLCEKQGCRVQLVPPREIIRR